MQLIELVTLILSIMAVIFSIVNLIFNVKRKKEIEKYLFSKQNLRNQIAHGMKNKENNYEQQKIKLQRSINDLAVLLEKDDNMKKYMSKNFINQTLKNENYINDIIIKSNN